MRKAAGVLVRRGVAGVCLVVSLTVWNARPARSGITGSFHDFSATSIGTAGSCGSCHLPHGSRESRALWTRSLGDERSYFSQKSDPDYVPGSTLLCYDCHDDGAATLSPAVDKDPPSFTWDSGRAPQDIAFSDGTLRKGGGRPGYYELINGDVPGGATEPPPAGSPTGGHYWKSEPSGTPDYQRGDKIACNLCHDPHNARTGSNEAFFLTSTTDGNEGKVTLGDGLDASNRNDEANPNRSRNGTGTGREMCSACHGYANTGVPARLWGVTLQAPPATVPQHDSSSAVPCTLCHPHNKVVVSCGDCHGFPPLLTEAQAGGLFAQGDAKRKDAENYPGGAGAHQRHKDALGDAIFQCTLCHGPNAGTASWHNQGNGKVTAENVDLMGERAAWDPGNTRTTAYTGISSSLPVPDGYEFTARGGGDQRCSGLACHGNPPNSAGALNWTDDMADGDLPYDNPAPGDIRVCSWCHGATPAVIDFGSGPVVAPNVAGDGATWGAGVNGHGLSGEKYDRDAVGDGLGRDGAAKDCAVCHDGRYRDNAGRSPASVPYLTHFDKVRGSAEKRLKGANGTRINGLDAADADAVCAACHQNTGPDAGTQVSSHGNDFSGSAEGSRGSVARSCRQCHDVHGANWNNAGALPRNLHMVGRWVDANRNGVADDPANEAARVDSNATDATANVTSADLPVVFVRRGTPTTSSADDSFDDGFNDGRHESVCVVCHRSADLNPQHGGSPVSNTYESTALQGAGHGPAGADCTSCHGHDPDKEPGTADGFAPVAAAAAGECTSCHGSKATGQFWPDGSSGAPAYADDAGGSGQHDRHVLSISRKLYGQTLSQLLADADSGTRQKEICAFCHPDPGGSGHEVNAGAGVYANRVDVWFDGQNDGGGGSNYLQAFKAGDGAHGNDAGVNATYDPKTLRCSNADCHYQRVTPVNGSLGWNGGDADPADCETCHFTRGVVDSKTYPTRPYVVGTAAQGWADGDLPDAHLAHSAGIAAPNAHASKAYPCSTCHDVSGYTPSHGNGRVEVSPAGSPKPTGDEKIAVASTAVKYGAGAVAICAGFYCHGGDFAEGTRGTDVTPVWNDYATATCGTCHNFNVRAGYDALQPLTQGAHGTHLNGASGIAYGPPSTGDGHPADCTSCHGFKNPGSGTYCAVCHGPSGTVHLADAGNDGFVREPSRSHVEGAFEVDFENQDRGWNDVASGSGWTGAGTLAGLGTDFDDGTDICNRCHSTAKVNGRVGATLAKQNWGGEGYRLGNCFFCHNEESPAWSTPVSGGHAAPAKDAWWTSSGHGLGISGSYSPSGRAGAGADCTDCHDKGLAHLREDTGSPPHSDRLVAAGNALCSGCHDGAGTGSAVTQVSTHGNTSSSLGSGYTPKRAAFELNCVECHDVHGTANAGMINAANPDGPLVAPRVYNGSQDELATFLYRSSSVSFTDDSVGTGAADGVGFADTAAGGNATKICQTCHTKTGHYQYASNDGHNTAVCTGCHRHDFDGKFSDTSQDGFMPKVTCEGCHSGADPLAPNVMGDGTMPTGDPGHATPKPYDDGSYGYNVNGHGRDSDTNDVSRGNAINMPCSICHDITVPAGTHLDGVLDGRKPSAFNTNPFHLVAGYIDTAPANEWSVQVKFDDFCYSYGKNTCHKGKTKDDRHLSSNDALPNYPQMGTHGTYAEPANSPPPFMFYDANITWLGSFNGPPNFVICVSCHNPHGTNTASPRMDRNNKMVIYRWENPATLCSRCHL